MTISKQAEMNVTPLIDVLLVLLIIFIVLISQQSIGLEALLPQPHADAAPSTPEPNTVVIKVREDRTLTINSQPISWSDLPSRLQAIFARRPDGVLFITAAASLEFQDVARVLDLSRGAGIHHIAFLKESH